LTTLWLVIVAVAVANAAIKASGPIAVGGRELPPRATSAIALLAPALLAALVVTQTFSEGQRLILDERAAGVAVAGIALYLKAPVLVAIALAAIVTALMRAFV
jgi:uncharacterized membrane protein